jgi:uncharacterized membrane protein YkoI
MQAKLKLVSGLLLGLFLADLTNSTAVEQSQTVKLEEAPVPVQKTILTQVGEGKLGDIDKVTEDGETRYDVEFARRRVERSFSVAPDGRLISCQVFMREVPESVRKTIRAQVGEAKLGDIDKTFEEGRFTYDVEMTRNGVERSFTVGADGKLLDLQVFITETPEAVQKAIRKQVENGSITRIDKNIEDEETAYDVEAQTRGAKISFSVDPNGKLIDMED